MKTGHEHGREGIGAARGPEGRAGKAKVLLVIGHGRRDSLCHRLLAAARGALEAGGTEARVQDLLADGFDPVLRLPEGVSAALPEHVSPLARRYQEDLVWMDALVVVHPVWWFGPPAILKGWVDQVLVETVAFLRPPSGNPRPLLGGRRALLVQTFNAPRAVDRLLMRGISESFWRRVVFRSAGIRMVQRLAFHGVERTSAAGVERMEGEVARAAAKLL